MLVNQRKNFISDQGSLRALFHVPLPLYCSLKQETLSPPLSLCLYEEMGAGDPLGNSNKVFTQTSDLRAYFKLPFLLFQHLQTGWNFGQYIVLFMTGNVR